MGVIISATDKMQSCIDACQKCTQACYECFSVSLNEPDLHMRKTYVSMLIECAMMCQISAATMSMSGKFSKEHCALCAEICEKCALECDIFKNSHCQKCVEVCRICAEECKKMAAM